MRNRQFSEVDGRPLFWLGGVCAAITSIDKYTAIIDFLERVLDIEDDQAKLNYLRRFENEHPTKVAAIIDHYSLANPWLGLDDPGQSEETRQGVGIRERNPAYADAAERIRQRRRHHRRGE